MTEQREDETLAWAREMVADLGDPGEKPEEVLRVLGTTDPESDVLAAMARLPEHWQHCIADLVQRIAEELAEEPGEVRSEGRHRTGAR